MVTTALAASVVIAVFTGIFFFGARAVTVPNSPAAKSAEMASEKPRKGVIDLRPYERVRGEARSNPDRRPDPLILERANLDLTVQLPIGSEEGKYLFELLDSSGVRRLETSGDAAIKDYITAAEAPFDLRRLSPGPFTLNVRRADELEPARYPVEIR